MATHFFRIASNSGSVRRSEIKPSQAHWSPVPLTNASMVLAISSGVRFINLKSYQLWSADFQLRISDFGFRIAEWGLERREKRPDLTKTPSPLNLRLASGAKNLLGLELKQRCQK